MVIACDSKAVALDIRMGTEGRHPVIVKEIVTRVNDLAACDITFEGRASNWEAHSLAKFSSSLVFWSPCVAGDSP